MHDLSVTQAAIELGVHRETLKRRLRTGEIRGYRIGRLWRITRADLDGFKQRELTPNGSKSDQQAKSVRASEQNGQTEWSEK